MKRIALAVAMMTLLAAGAALAQVGGITGIVVNGDGVPVEGARVSLWLDGQCDGYVIADANGVFAFEEVAVGTYSVKAAKPQVGQVTLDGVEVIENEITDVGTLALVCGGPQGSGGPKFQYQMQNRFQND